MANKTYTYDVYWSWKDQGNRVVEEVVQVKATTVQRACSKAVKELNLDPDREGEYFDKDDEAFIRAADVLIIGCQNVTKGWAP